MALINKKSIFANLKTVDYFSNTNAIGFTKKKNKTEFTNLSVRSGTYQYTGILASGSRIAIYSSSSIALDSRTSEYLSYGGSQTTDLRVTAYPPVSFNTAMQNFMNRIATTPGGIYGKLYFMTFGNGVQNSYASMLSINQQTSLSDYYKLNTLSLKNNVSTSEPYVIRDIGSRYSKIAMNQNFNSETTLFRSGPTTLISSAVEDTSRIGRFLTSSRGAQFLLKQFGLQLMNPRPETTIFNPLSISQNVGGAAIGLHFDRHATLFGIIKSDRYELSKEATSADSNRLTYFKNKLFSGNDTKSSPLLNSFGKALSSLPVIGGFVANVLGNNDYIPARAAIPLLGDVAPGVSLNQHSIYGIRVGMSWPSSFGYLRTRYPNTTYSKTDEAYLVSGVVTRSLTEVQYFPALNLYPQGVDELGNVINPGDEIGVSATRDEFVRYRFKSHKDYAQMEKSKTYESIMKNSSNSKEKYLEIYSGSYLSAATLSTTNAENLYESSSKDKNYATKYSHPNIANISRYGRFVAPVTNSNEEAITIDKDVAHIIFSPLDGKQIMKFRAIIENYTDTYSPSWNTVTYVGNPINYPIYQNTKRSIQISFKVPIYYETELAKVKRNINRLALYTYPIGINTTYKQDGETLTNLTRIATPYLRFSLENYLPPTLAVLTSVVFTIDTNTPWIGSNHLDDKAKHPIVINVAVGMEIVPDRVPYAEERRVEVLKQLPVIEENKPEETPPARVPLYEQQFGTNFAPTDVDASATYTKSADGRIIYNNNRINR